MSLLPYQYTMSVFHIQEQYMMQESFCRLFLLIYIINNCCFFLSGYKKYNSFRIIYNPSGYCNPSLMSE